MNMPDLPRLPRLSRLMHPPYKHSYLRLLNAAYVLRSFVMVGLNIFIVQYLYTLLISLGCSVEQTLILIGLIFLMLPLSHFIFIPYASRYLSKVGIKSAFITSLLLFSLLSWFGFQIDSITWYPFIFVIWGISASLWWYTFHIFFLEVGDPKKVGRDVSFNELMILVCSISAPIVLGFLIEGYGYGVASILNVVVTAVAIFVVMFMKDFETLPSVSYRAIIGSALDHPRHFFAFFAYGMDEGLRGFVWPLFLFFIFKDPLLVGVAVGGIALGSAFFLLLSGRLSDSISRSKLEHFGAVMVGLTWVIRAFTLNPVLITFSDIVYRSMHSFFSVPLNAHGMSIGMKTNKSLFVGFRETAVLSGNAFVMLIMITLVAFGLPFYATFLFGIVITALAFLLRDSHTKVDPRLHRQS